MREFDLEKAKAGAPVCTRDGKPARIICWDYQGHEVEKEEDKFPIIALVKFYDGERTFLYRESGKCSRVNKDDELVMATVKHEGWVIITGDSCLCDIHKSEGDAIKFAKRKKIDYTAITHIEWEE